MKPCNNPDHPHCTVWVLPGDATCAHGHVQLPEPTMLAPHLEDAGQRRFEPAAAQLPNAAATDAAPAISSAPAGVSTAARPHLHVSGFDPRAAGGRQLLKLELRGMPPDCPAPLTLLAKSRLRLEHDQRQAFVRNGRGEWLPVFIEFSSRGIEHGQYRIELELLGGATHGLPARAWTATLSVLVPRADASLFEIHQTFLATHKNVRVHAEDASIARVRGRLDGGGRVDIEVGARNAGIAHLDLDTGGGKIDLGVSSIAWDEELFDLDVPAGRAPSHPCPVTTACILAAGPGQARHLRLFALDDCVLGRLEAGAQADILLAHHDSSGPVLDGLTRRISAQHARIRRGREGFEIEDVSRFGLLVDGSWPGKHAPLTLRTGMRIELTASIPGVAVLEVAAVLPHGVVLRRLDAGSAHELFYLVAPEQLPDSSCPPPPGLPLLFHRDGGFRRRDALSGMDTALATGVTLPDGARFTPQAYPDLQPATRPAALAAPAPAC